MLYLVNEFSIYETEHDFGLIQRDRVGQIIIFIKISNPRTFECTSACVFQRGINVSSESRLTHKRVNSVLMGSRKSTESTSSSGASHRIYDAWQIRPGWG